MFLIDVKFTVPDKITPELTARHRKHLATEYATGNLLVGGPKVPRIGGVILSCHSSLKKVVRLMESDPLVVANLAEFTVTEFKPLMANEKFYGFLPTTGL